MFVLPNFILSWQHIEAWGSQLTDGIIRLGRELGPHKVTERVHSSTGTAKSQARVLCVAQRVRHLPAMQETWVRSLEKEMATHSSILAWRIPWTEEPGGLQSTGLQRVRHDWATLLSLSITLRREWDLHKVTERVSGSAGTAKSQARVLCATCITWSSYYSIFLPSFKKISLLVEMFPLLLCLLSGRLCVLPCWLTCASFTNVKWSESCSVMSDSLWPHGLSRPEYWSGLPGPPQGIFPTQGSNPGLPHCRWTLLPAEPPCK